MESYRESLVQLGERVRALRFIRGLKQSELASRAGVSIGVVQRLEATGRASIENVLRVAMALGAEEGVERLFEPIRFRTLDEALEADEKPKRRRVRGGPR